LCLYLWILSNRNTNFRSIIQKTRKIQTYKVDIVGNFDGSTSKDSVLSVHIRFSQFYFLWLYYNVGYYHNKNQINHAENKIFRMVQSTLSKNRKKGGSLIWDLATCLLSYIAEFLICYNYGHRDSKMGLIIKIEPIDQIWRKENQIQLDEKGVFGGSHRPRKR